MTQKNQNPKRRDVPAAATPVVEVKDVSVEEKVTRAKRRRFVLCNAAILEHVKSPEDQSKIPQAKLIREKVEIPEEIWGNKMAIKDFAKRQFKAKFNAEPQEIDCGGNGIGYYDVQGTGQTKVNELTLTVPRNKLKYTNNEYHGILQGWKVDAMGVKSIAVNGHQYKDDELVEVNFRARHEVGAERPRLTAGAGNRILFRLDTLVSTAPEYWPDSIKDAE